MIADDIDLETQPPSDTDTERRICDKRNFSENIIIRSSGWSCSSDAEEATSSVANAEVDSGLSMDEKQLLEKMEAANKWAKRSIRY